MDFHEIDTKGKLWIQRVSSKPAFASTDTGRVIYVTGENKFYFASSTAWSVWGSDVIPAGTKMVFYQNTAPDGWTIDATVADALIAIKGGSQAYNVNGGQLAGTWVQTNHTHTFSDSFSASHSHSVDEHQHRTQDYDGGSMYAWNGSGTRQARAAFGYSAAKLGGGGMYSNSVSKGDPSYSLGDFWVEPIALTTNSADASDTVSGTTSNNSSVSDWRPYAAISIVATKD